MTDTKKIFEDTEFHGRVSMVGGGDSSVRLEILDQALGYLTETFDIAGANTAVAVATQSLRVMPVGLRKGDSVTGGVVSLVASGATVTLAKMGLYDPNTATLLASSADASGTVQGATGKVTFTFSSSFTVKRTGGYYMALLLVGAALPTVAGSPTISANTAAAVTNKLSPTGAMAAQSDLPASGLTVAASTAPLWMGALGTPAGGLFF